MITASADYAESFISGDEMVRRMTEQPDWEWNDANATYFEDDEEKSDAL